MLIDKPEGITSHDVVARVRRILGTKEVGHTGTLDPFATGLMVLLIGQATKLSDYLRDGDKGYRVEVKLGLETDSLDRTGQIQQSLEVHLSSDKIKKAILAAQGELELPVPMFSAVKIKGKKLYQYAREGAEILVPIKSMNFYSVKIIDISPDSFIAEVSCSKGSYIRAWAKYIGELLGVPATAMELRRTHSSHFQLDSAVTLEQLETSSGFSGCFLTPLVKALPDWKTVTVGGKDLKLLKSGQISHDVQRRLVFEQKTAQKNGKILGIKVISGESGELLSLLEASPNHKLKVKRVFQYADRH